MSETFRRNLGENVVAGTSLGVSIAVSSDPAGGVTESSTIVIVFVSNPNIPITFSCTDSQGNTYSQDSIQTLEGSGVLNGYLIFFSTHNATPLETGDSISVQGSTGALGWFASAQEWTGLTTGSAGGATSNVGTFDGGVSPTTAGTLDTTVPHGALIGVHYTSNNDPAFWTVEGGGVTWGASEVDSTPDGGEIRLLNRVFSSPTSYTMDGSYAAGNTPGEYASAFQSYRGESVVVFAMQGAGQQSVSWNILSFKSPAMKGVGLQTFSFNVLSFRDGMRGIGRQRVLLGAAFVALTGSNGLFTRLGLIGGLIDTLNLHRGTTVPGKVDTLRDAYDSLDELPDGIYGQFASFQRGGFQSTLRYLETLAQDTVVRMVNDSAKLPDEQLSTALTELVRQMSSRSQSIESNTVSAAWMADDDNEGNAVLVLSVLDAHGQPLQYSLAERLRLTVTTDHQSGATAGQESLSLAAEPAERDSLSFAWPAGSGSSSSLTTTDEDGGQTLLTDGGFEIWTGTALDDWTFVTGTFAKSTDFYLGTYSLQLTGDGSAVPLFYQTFAEGLLGPFRQYAVNVWVKLSGGFDSALTLKLGLYDAPAGTLTQDDAGTNNVAELTLAGQPQGVWLPFSGTFRTGRLLTGTETLRLETSAILASGATVKLDSLTLTEMTQVYDGGPSLSMFAGDEPLIIDDAYSVVVSNSRNSDWAKLLDRLFDLKGLGVVIPNDPSPSISDNLII